MKKFKNLGSTLTTIIKYAGIAIAVVSTLKHFKEQLEIQGIISKSDEDADISK